ncbi:adenine nucleotide transporter [Thelephora terrestris]|uniref:Adenine nucleotide transporter n=1 Tax=Thelephora terrestris TaxID=56493 RepID=A0A9P6H4R5_9AGAM|nr:adenine nucleotide transporter [Thelephora terrestris]
MSTQSKPVKQQQLTPFGHALAGALGACFSTAVVYPLDVAKTRIQAEKSSKPQMGMFRLLLAILKDDGVWGLYRGFTATMLNTFSMQYAYFFFYSLVRGAYIKRRTAQRGNAPGLSTAVELMLGAAAGGLAQIFTIPVSVIATRQQVGSSTRTVRRKVVVPSANGTAIEGANGNGEDEGFAEKWIEEEEYVDNSFWGVGREIVREEGVTGLWLGIKPGLVLTVNPAITYGMFERIKSVLLLAQEKAASVAAPSNGKLTPGTNFLVGALSKTLATVVTYPYIMAKVRIQTRGSDARMAQEKGLPAPPHHAYHHGANSKHPGALDLLRAVYKREGLVGWYQGMGAQIVKAVLSQALLFMSKDQFEHWALAIMAMLYVAKK